METMNKVNIGNFMIQFLAPRNFYFIRNVGPYMGDTALFERLFNQVQEWMKENNIPFTRDMEAITVYHDDPQEVPPEMQRISVGFTLHQDLPVSDNIQKMELPAGNYAIGRFEIFPHQYEDAWNEIFEYLESEQLSIVNGIMYESYKNNPHTHKEGKHIVDICIAIRNK